MHTRRMAFLFCLSLGLGPGLTACGEFGQRGEGEACFASSECAAGLTCDFGVDEPVCRSQQTPPEGTPPSTVDAAPRPDAEPGAEPDAAPGGEPDAALPDAAVPDAAIPDAAVPDAAIPDAAVPDAAVPDAA
ncbi:hypothetical protein [Haliangium ochraceum]|uniref:Lipoprotein n=1 Tax=Haliangium ochraceum (strain DSM 14365 / JCM 11303 / SMP-2) TaxID=502025 RepID=D0LJE8_HALO1|nr:hypothetical protein [Haliangium ochraceum]ACY16522.1 hypothetical protein Hoch_4023 [Haliangium ochraceum DSM 14365]